MSNEMIIAPQLDMAALEHSARQLVQSKYSAERNPIDALWLIATGAGLGIDPATSLRAIHVIKGKPVLSADLMSAVAMRHPACEYLMVRKMSAEECIIATRRRGWPEEMVMSWTIDDAKRAGLANGDNWKKYPQAMLKARCLGQIVRAAYPDALMGCYVEGELEETREEAPAVAHPDALDVTPAPQPPPARRAPSREDEGAEHDALCAQLRTWLKEAQLGKERNAEIVEGFLERHGDGAGEMGRVPLKALKTGIEDLAVRIERHGLATALRDLCEWAPQHIEAPMDGPERTPTAA